MRIGALELVVVFIVALLVIGPDKLPAYARRFGAAMKEFRKASADVTQEIRESVIDPLEEAQKPLREAVEPIAEMDRELKAGIRDVEKDLKNIGKAGQTKPAPAAAPAEETTAAAEEENSSRAENGGTAT